MLEKRVIEIKEYTKKNKGDTGGSERGKVI